MFMRAIIDDNFMIQVTVSKIEEKIKAFQEKKQ